MKQKSSVSKPEKALRDLIRISNATGKDPSLVQGGGGNTSVKTDDGKFMYIKASGTALKDMAPNRGWRRLRLDAVLKIIQDKELTTIDQTARESIIVNRLMSSCDDDMPPDNRPSVESHLHAFLGRCIIHLHPTSVGAYVNAVNAKSLLQKLLKKEKYPPLWVPYTDPGFCLARKMSQLVRNYQIKFNRKPELMFLEKHGLFVSADNPEAALRAVRNVIKICNRKLKTSRIVKIKQASVNEINSARLAIRQGFFNATGRYTLIKFCNNQTIASFLSRPDAPKLLNTGSITPDELIYAGGSALWLNKCDPKTVNWKLSAYLQKGKRLPSAFLVKNLGLLVAGDEKSIPVVEDVTNSSLIIRSTAADLGGVNTLNRRQEQFIDKWEAESYREQIVTKTTHGDLKNRLALITGAGSGLGRAIALGMARDGAIVAIGDIDKKAAEQTVALIKTEMPGASAISISCDVTNEISVENAYNELLDKWGGLDILVNAAGIGPAMPLVDLPLKKWRQALEINLTGYFLMARSAARIMIQQAIGGNIINISSKSALEASKDNSAYNASKAGQLHLARGWAMELGDHAIRVNCVCPGNVFEGSKIWNPQYIKACARKYGIKPDEVIPYYTNKTILKRQIMGADVANAVVFLCSEKARTITGQIIVPDGGQVMLR